MATEKPTASRTDMLTAYLKVKPLELVVLLELAGLPSKEALPRGYIPAKKELDLIIQSYFDLWILYFNNTRPYPLDEAGRRRLLPLSYYEKYRRRLGELIEIRHDHRRQLARELLQIRREMEIRDDLSSGELNRRLADEMAVEHRYEPTPTLDRFLEEPPGKAEPPILYRNGEYPPDYRQQAAERYNRAIAQALRLGRQDNPSQYRPDLI